MIRTLGALVGAMEQADQLSASYSTSCEDSICPPPSPKPKVLCRGMGLIP